MNFLFPIFFILCSVSIIMTLYNLFLTNRKKVISNDIMFTLDSMSNKEKARYMIKLLEKGYILRHILRNDGPEHNNEQYLKSYCSFLNAETIYIIKSIKGDRLYE